MGAAYDPAAWAAFFSALTSASAGLTGLIFVAVSINLSKIIELRQLIARAAKALFTLMGVLVISILCLVPSQSELVLGMEIALSGVAIWLANTLSQHAAARDNPFVTPRRRLLLHLLTQCSAIPFVAAGISLLLRFGGGLYWLVVGIIFALFAALIDAWVLLIEIQR